MMDCGADYNALINNFEELKLDTYQNYNPDKYYYVVSIDIGVKHLGMTLSSVHKNFNLEEVIWLDMIDITIFDNCDKKNCNLYHEKTLCDYLEHLFHTHDELFNIVDWALIERQPPMGYVAVEQLIFSKFRDKSVLISPNSVHAYFGWIKAGLDYEARKIYSNRVAELVLKKSNRNYLLDKWGNLVDREGVYRKHDVSDSICILLYFLNREHKKWIVKDRKLRIQREIEQAKKEGIFHSHIYLENFRFIG